MKKYILFVSIFVFTLNLLSFNISYADVNNSAGSVVEITAKSGNQYVDAAPAIKAGIARLVSSGGGTLFFGPGKYIVSKTIELPSNITIQGVGSGDVGPCMIILGVQGNMNAQGMALFSILPGAKNVIIRDVELRSMTPGMNVYPRNDISRINSEQTTAIRMLGTNTGPISDIQFENIRITNFTYAINAGSKNGGDATVKNVKIRSVSTNTNYLALKVNSLNAQNWDVQNLNVVEMSSGQNGVLLARAGKMAFLQVSCASTLHNANLCLDIGQRSSPLYFRQIHVEGPRQGLLVRSSSSQPIYLNDSAISGSVEAKSVIYSIANRYSPNSTAGSLSFSGQGSSSTLYACGDVFTTGYPTETKTDLAYSGLNHQPKNCDFKVNEVSNTFSTGALPFNLFNWLSYNSTVSLNVFNVKSFGAKGDGSTDDTTAIKSALAGLTTGNSTWAHSTLLFPAGHYRVSDTLNLDGGTILQGEPGTIIEFTGTNRPLFQVRVMQSDAILKRSINIKGMALHSMTSDPASQNTTAIEFSGNRGGTGDHTFYNLEITGFTHAFYVHNDSGNFDSDQPMVDSIAVRNLNLINNNIGIELKDQNASNWNFEDVHITNMQSGQKGVVINGGGMISLRNLYCEGGSEISKADTCLTVSRHSGVSVDNMQSKNMNYAMYSPWPIGWTPAPVSIRNSNLTDGVYVAGKIYLISNSNTFAAPSVTNSTGVNQSGSRSIFFNTYGSDDPSNVYPGDDSFVTSCGDIFINPTDKQVRPLQFIGLKKSPKVCFGTPSPVSTGSLSISPSDAKLKIGGTATFQAMFSNCPTGAQCFVGPMPIQATWSSSDTKIATVAYKDNCPIGTNCFSKQLDYKTAVVTGVSEGIAIITATYTDASNNKLTAAFKAVVSNSSSNSNITVISPLGGESWIKGSTQTINWQDANNLSTHEIKLTLYQPPCTGKICPMYSTPSPYTIANTKGSPYSWSVGTTLNNSTIPDGQYILQVCQTDTSNCGAINTPIKISSTILVCEYPAPPTGYHYEGGQPYPTCGAYLVADATVTPPILVTPPDGCLTNKGYSSTTGKSCVINSKL